MNNNKQTMKLYTEEQLLNTVKSIRHYDEVYDEKVANERVEKHLKALQPIELPSDEEIENMAIEYFNYAEGIEYEKGFYKIGAKMAINKIQENNQ